MRTFTFFLNSILLGVALAMDAFSVSCANGLNEPNMKKGKMLGIAGIFGFFQFAMPMIGWICIVTVADIFNVFQKFIPWIALILLLYIGIKMLIEGIKSKNSGCEAAVGFKSLMIQGIATSIDALSVGFTMAQIGVSEAIIEALIIGIVTFGICIAGLFIGKKFGNILSGKASILGGVILIAIGIEIFVKSFF